MPEITEEKEAALHDEKYIQIYFKDSILKQEQNFTNDPADELLTSLLTSDSTVPRNASDREAEYFSALKSPQSGKALTNLSEYLLDTAMDQGHGATTTDVAFWFRLGF